MLNDMQRRLYNTASNLENGGGPPPRQKGRAVSLVFVASLACFFVWSFLGLYTSAPFLLWLIVISGWVISLALHEYGHALVAFWGGDQSVLEAGYLSLNFLLYVDPIMSLLLPVLMLALGGVPLPGGSVLVNHSNLRSAHWDAGTSLAGPVMNLVFGTLMRVALLLTSVLTKWIAKDDYIYHGCTGRAWTVLIYLQVVAAILNLVPLPPLDGWGIVSPYLSPSCSVKAWLHRSSWNYKTMSLVTFGIIYIVASATPFLETLHKPITAVWLLDSSLLASGFGAFFSAFRFA
eukprot:Blabericola_migrator_1__12440@NODE_784_length_6546_cov_108_280599_g555_i0_p5_GENE_NODE_784_length_6546_cov_108_280599_g555_i0NODE_784_length_6546_cov_108_280599_g555_i0_p5_ORF_typecomplete_len290_score39_37Peptidase_M50/PF02163_22/0_00046Peptidase_M50/PF02163_22/0_0039DUF3040/PF11239_8/0_39DUF3040/PF11239_8/1_8e04_NODE_784_length_6546_cov_108_280599_g555_i012242093